MTQEQIDSLLSKLALISESVSLVLASQTALNSEVSPEEQSALARLRYETDLKNAKTASLAADLQLIELEKRKADLEAMLLKQKEQLIPTS